MRRDVVDAEERGAAIERGDRSADGCRDRCRRGASGSPRTRAERALAREADEHRAARCGRCASRPRSSSRFCADASCRSRCPGRGRRAPRGSPRRRRTRAAPRGTRRPPRRRRRIAASTCIVRGSPCMCMRQTYAPASATTPASSGSPRSAVTSLTSSAPSPSARRATSAFDVSIETGSPASRLEHGQDAAQLLVERDGVRARSGRLAADVDERRALGEQPRAPSRPRPRGRGCSRRRRSCRA